MAQKVTLNGEYLGDFDFQKLTLKELFAIKAATQLSGAGFGKGVGDLEPAALQALVWHMLAKRGEHVAIATIDFALDELKLTEAEEPATDPGNVTSSETGETAISEPSVSSSDSNPTTLTL